MPPLTVRQKQHESQLSRHGSLPRPALRRLDPQAPPHPCIMASSSLSTVDLKAATPSPPAPCSPPDPDPSLAAAIGWHEVPVPCSLGCSELVLPPPPDRLPANFMPKLVADTPVASSEQPCMGGGWGPASFTDGEGTCSASQEGGWSLPRHQEENVWPLLLLPGAGALRR